MHRASVNLISLKASVLCVVITAVSACGGAKDASPTSVAVDSIATGATNQGIRDVKIPGGGSAPVPEPGPTTPATPAPAPTPLPPADPASAPVFNGPVIAGAPNVDGTKIPKGAVGSSIDLLKPTTDVVATSNMGSFRTVCDFSHMSFDDPIVYPGQPGLSHLHAFFGNTGTNANSTASSLLSTGNSTCRGGTINRSAYWIPAIIDTKDGTPVKPDALIVYYKNGGRGVSASEIRAIPPGLRMIAGDPSASAPVMWGPISYRCDDLGQLTYYIPNCDVGHQVWASLVFPQCWDGVNLDSPDHRSHMMYYPIPNPPNNKCPPSHPVALPEVAFNVLYTVTEANAPTRWRMASDRYDSSIPGGYSFHGDYFMGWRPEIMDIWIRDCIQAQVDCFAHLLGDGRQMYQ